MSGDASELNELAADLSGVPAEANKNIMKALQYTSVEIKKDWRQGAEVSGSYANTYAPAIDFDIKFPGGAIESEIGPSLGKTPGASAGFLEEAPGGVDGPPTHAGRDALEANEEDFYRGLEIAITNAVVDKVEGG